NRSFFSGHSSMAFTGAGLVCFHQQQLAGLYGSRAAGIGVCGSALAFASTTALLRVAADKHWSTDVLAGAGVGIFSGWLLPWLLHGRSVVDVNGEHVRGAVLPIVDRGTYGLELRGSFEN
ncbi:MAG: phosphatase PAP2 family protein, partial [Polyangiaceae bacterium]|nr:phosphatase PAP2 family protein [Polyangiaceae bacterium]